MGNFQVLPGEGELFFSFLWVNLLIYNHSFWSTNPPYAMMSMYSHCLI